MFMVKIQRRLAAKRSNNPIGHVELTMHLKIMDIISVT